MSDPHTETKPLAPRSPLFCVSLRVRAGTVQSSRGCGVSFLVYPSSCSDSDKVSAFRCSLKLWEPQFSCLYHGDSNIWSLSCAISSPWCFPPSPHCSCNILRHHCRPQCCIIQLSYLGCPSLHLLLVTSTCLLEEPSLSTRKLGGVSSLLLLLSAFTCLSLHGRQNSRMASKIATLTRVHNCIISVLECRWDF